MSDSRNSTILLIASFAFFAGLVGAYAFLFIQFKELHTVTMSMEQELIDKEKRAHEQLELERAITSTEADRKALESYFVSGDRAVSFLETLEGYGKLASVGFEFRTVNIERTDAGVSTLVFSAHAIGTFSGVHKLLRLFENAPYEFNFESTNFRQLTIDTTKTKEVKLPEIPGIESVLWDSAHPLWDAEYTIRLTTFNPTEHL